MRKGRLLILLAFATINMSTVYAQELEEGDTRYYRHEVNVSRAVVFLSRAQWNDYEKGIYDALSIESRKHGYDDISSGFLISYYYHPDYHIAFGAAMAYTSNESSIYGTYRQEVEVPNGHYWNEKNNTWEDIYRIEKINHEVDGGKIKEKSFLLMPSLKWSWLNNNWCSLYMKTSLGLHYQHREADTEGLHINSNEDFGENKLWFAYWVTPLGWEIGRQKVRAFIEFGLGSSDNIQIGLTYRFGRY